MHPSVPPTPGPPARRAASTRVCSRPAARYHAPMRTTPFAIVLAFAACTAAAVAQELDFEAAAAFSAENAGLAVLVYERGELVFEQYQNGHAEDRPQHLFSGTKSFAPMVALIACEEGLLDLDEPVADTITEWRGDPRRERITVRHLLQFTSGLEHIDRALHSPRTRDTYAAAIACKGEHEPGARFRYGSNHLTVFGALLERKLRAASTPERPLPEDFVGYLDARVLDPIGCRSASCIRDAAGCPARPFGAQMTAREWAKFGLLVLGRGKWGERQVVPAERFDECFRGSEANARYGLNFWLIGAGLHRREPAIPADTVSAAGMYDQRLYVVPSREVLVVRLGRTGARSRFGDFPFLQRLFAATGDGR